MEITDGFGRLFSLTYFLLGIAYFIYMLNFLSQARNRVTDLTLPLYFIQLVLFPIILLFIGALLFFLNSPIDEDLQVVLFLNLLLVIFLLGKDILVSRFSTNR